MCFYAIDSCHGVLCDLVHVSASGEPSWAHDQRQVLQVQMGQFKRIQLDTESNNELGILAKCLRKCPQSWGDFIRV